MHEIEIHPRVFEKRPWLDADEIRYSWRNYLASAQRACESSEQVVRIGVCRNGAMMELIAVGACGDYLIYHAKVPPTKAILRELGL